MIKKLVYWFLYKLHIKKYAIVDFTDDAIGAVIGALIISLVREVVDEVVDEEYRKLSWGEKVFADFYFRCKYLRKVLIGY